MLRLVSCSRRKTDFILMNLLYILVNEITHDYRPNWTQLSPITITHNNNDYNYSTLFLSLNIECLEVSGNWINHKHSHEKQCGC